MSGQSRQAIVFVNHYFFPDQSATSQILTDLAFDLARSGQRIRVVTSRKLYGAEGPALPASEVVHGVEVQRVRATSFGRHWGLAGKAIDSLTLLLALIQAMLRTLRPGDVVVAKTDPPMLAVIVAPIARLRGAVLVNWWQDVFPEVAQAMLGKRRLLAPAFAVMRWLRNRAMKAAEINVVIGQRMADHMRSQGASDQQIRVIQNWSDASIASTVSGAKELRHDWGLDGKFVVCYSGNLGRAHDVETTLAAIGLLEAGLMAPASEPIAWVFIGGGAGLTYLRAESQRRNLRSIVFQPYQPREQLGASLAVGDVHLVSLLPEFEGLIVPSKFYGIAAAGRPTIFVGDKRGEIAQIVESYRCGRSVEVGDGIGLARLVTELADDQQDCKKMGAEARAAFDRAFDRPLAIAQWRDVLSSCLLKCASRARGTK